MAVDKLVDSTQLDADLTSVANAIRSRGGTSGNLAFPTGFVNAINGIPSGEPPDGNFMRYGLTDGTMPIAGVARIGEAALFETAPMIGTAQAGYTVLGG